MEIPKFPDHDDGEQAPSNNRSGNDGQQGAPGPIGRKNENEPPTPTNAEDDEQQIDAWISEGNPNCQDS